MTGSGSAPRTILRTLLHIGSDKTGTTALQAAMAEARPALADAGLWYPDLDGRPDHRVLAGSPLPPRLVPPAGTDTIVLSSEALWSLSARTIERLLAWLPDGEIMVVGFVRRPADFAEAAFLQRCQMARSDAALRALVASRSLPGPINPVAARAVGRLRQLERWVDRSEHVGAANLRRSIRVVARAYDPEVDIVEAFATAAEVEAVAPLLADRRVRRRNPTLGLVAVQASVLVRQRSDETTRRRFLADLAALDLGALDLGAGERRSVLSPGLRANIERRAKPLLERLQTRIGGLEALIASIEPAIAPIGQGPDRSADRRPTPALDRDRAEALIAQVWPGLYGP